MYHPYPFKNFYVSALGSPEPEISIIFIVIIGDEFYFLSTNSTCVSSSTSLSFSLICLLLCLFYFCFPKDGIIKCQGFCWICLCVATQPAPWTGENEHWVAESLEPQAITFVRDCFCCFCCCCKNQVWSFAAYLTWSISISSMMLPTLLLWNPWVELLELHFCLLKSFLTMLGTLCNDVDGCLRLKL